MKALYLQCGTSRQAHHQAMERLGRQLDKEQACVGLMEQTRQIHPGMGLRAMYELVRPAGMGRDAFVALGLREGFRLKALEKYTRTTHRHPSSRYANLLGGHTFTDVNQVWSSDITYLYCLGRFYYLALIMDVYSRRIVGYSLADHMRAENNLAALSMALTLRGRGHYGQGLIHHSDRGGQYVSDLYTDTLDSYGVRISMCREVYENAHIERVNETVKNQYLNRMVISSEKELRQKVDQVMAAYNTKRPHRSLQGMTPAGYEAHLAGVPMQQRVPMKIYTTHNADPTDPNQLKLMFT
ncbi:hypothetical protein BH24BAC1_BH24BAC1_31360 [soil metagenome]